ncbi:MAG: hypothetical protein AAB425_06915, partial [Bdellovibrionota bacterium]
TKEVRLIQTQVVPVDDGYRLPPPSDTKLKFLRDETGCYLEGLALYNDETQILEVDGKLFNSPLLSTTQKAALFVHEAVYKVFRQQRRVDSSILVRKIIAYLFSKQGFHPRPVDEALDRATYFCATVEPDFESIRKIGFFGGRKHTLRENAFLDNFTKVKEIGRSEFYVTNREAGNAWIQVTRWDRRDLKYLSRAVVPASDILIRWVRDGFPSYTGKPVPPGYPPQREARAMRTGVFQWMFSEFFPAIGFSMNEDTYYSPYPVARINRDHFGALWVSDKKIPVVCVANGPDAKERLVSDVARWLAKPK